VANKTKILNQVQKYIGKGQWEKAIKELQKLIADDPTDVRTLLKLGDVYSKQGDRESATRVYRQVAESYSEQGFFLKAVAVYKQILKHDPNHLEVTLRLAELYEQLNLASEALAQYQHASRIHEEAGDAKRSLEVLRRMVDLDPQNVASRIKLAEGFSREEMVGDASLEFERAATLLKEQNRLEDYVKVAERLVYHDPSRLDVVKDVAKLLLAQGETKRGLAKLQVLYKEDTKDVETLRLLARAFTDLGQAQKTLFVYRELARVHQEEGRPVDAAAVYQQILQLEPNDPEAKQALGYQSGLQPTVASQAPGIPTAPPTSAAVSPGPVSPGPLSPGPLSPPPVAPSSAPPVAPSSSPPPAAPVFAPSLAPRPAPPPSAPSPHAPSLAPRPPPPDALPDEDLGLALGSMDLVPDAPSAAPADPKEQIQKILTETDVFVRYGLRDKALEHLQKVFAIDPDHVGANEKARDVHLAAGEDARAAEAVARIVQIHTRRGAKDAMERARQELARLAPQHPLARSAAPPPVPTSTGESISIDIGETGDAGEPWPGEELSSIDVSTSGLLAVEDDDEADPFAGSVVDDRPLDDDVDPFAGAALQTDDVPAPPPHEPPPAEPIAAPAPTATATGPEVEVIPSQVFEVEAAGSAPATDASPVLMLEELEQEGDWAPGVPDGWLEGSSPDATSTDTEAPQAPTPDSGSTPEARTEVLALNQLDGPAPMSDPFGREDGFEDFDPFASVAGNGAPAGYDENVTDVFADSTAETNGTGNYDASIDDDLAEAEFLLQASLLDEAREVLEALTERAPADPRVQRMRAQLDGAASPESEPVPGGPDGPGTADLARRVEAMVGDQPVAQGEEDSFDQGLMFRDLGRLEDAIEAFKQALKVPERALASLEMIGHCLIDRTETKAGIECFKLALKRGAEGPAAINLKYEIGAAYESLDDLDRALQWYSACAEDDPGHRDVTQRVQGLSAPNDGGPRSSRNKISYL
jgi:tetratricopeptide (TPR) repeat protein